MKPTSATPLVSVVMPLYNAERFVGESIDSSRCSATNATSFEANPRVDICGSFYAIFDNDRGRESARCCKLLTSPDEIRYRIFFIDPLGMSTVMLRNEALRHTGIRFRECLSEDYQLWADLSDRLVMANIPECLIHYRRWENQTSSRKMEALIDCAAGIQRDLLDRRLGIRMTDDQTRIFARFTFRPETLQRSDLPFFRQLSIRFYCAYRQREPHTPSHLKRFLFEQYLASFRRSHPSWRTRIEKRLFRLALLIG